MKTHPTASRVALYQRLVGGDAWANLAAPVQQFHQFTDSFHGVGLFRVRHGAGLIARLLAWLARLPAPGERVPVRLVVTSRHDGEHWHREFAGKSFVTEQSAHDGHILAERIGPTEIRYSLEVMDHALLYRQQSAALRLGSLRVPLPRWLSPRIAAREWVMPGEMRTRVSVKVTLPLVGLLVHYEGYVEREERMH